MRVLPALLFVCFASACGASRSPVVSVTRAQKLKIHTRPTPGVKTTDCKPDIEVSPFAPFRRSACEAGDLYACHVTIVEDHPTEAMTEVAKRTLDDGCKTGSPCACALYGSALTFDDRKRFDAQALAILDRACSEGALDACDAISFSADVCSERRDDRVLCEKLREAGIARMPPPPPPKQLQTATLPEYLVDCFVVARDLGGDKCETYRGYAVAEGGGGICEIDPSACPKSFPEKGPQCETRKIGAAYCFAPDRVLVRDPKTMGWTQTSVHWRAFEGEATFVTSDFGVRLDGRDAIIDGRYRLARADSATRASAKQFLGLGFEICVHAKSCVDAIERLGGEAEDIVLDTPEFPRDAKGCARAEADAKRAHTGALPAACR